jgi:phospholipid/cholesterol/gamma-HCH transport system substrate-binding protein
MQSHTKLEVSVGLFVLLGLAALGYLSFTLGGIELTQARYAVSARFASVGDLKRGDAVKLAGVKVGEVEQIALVEFTAVVSLVIDRAVSLPRDSIASIKTSGLLGDAYVSLSPGGATENLVAGESIRQTESAISLTDLIGTYAFGSLDAESSSSARGQPRRAPSPSQDVLR